MPSGWTQITLSGSPTAIYAPRGPVWTTNAHSNFGDGSGDILFMPVAKIASSVLEIRLVYSDDYGATWTETGFNSSINYDVMSDFDMDWDFIDDKIHLAYANVDGSDLNPVEIYYNRYNVTLASPIEVTNEAIHTAMQAGGTGVTRLGIGLAARSDTDASGNGVIVCYKGPRYNEMGSSWDHCYYGYKAGGSWTTGALHSAAATANYQAWACVRGSSGTGHFIYMDQTNGNLKSRSITSSDTLNAEQNLGAILTEDTAATVKRFQSRVLQHVRDDAGTKYTVIADHASGVAQSVRLNESSGNLAHHQTDVLSGTSVRTSRYPVISARDTDDELWMIFEDSTSPFPVEGHYSNDDADTWTSDGDIESDINNGNVRTGALAFQNEDNDDWIIGYIDDNNTAGPFYYGDHVIQPGAVTSTLTHTTDAQIGFSERPTHTTDARIGFFATHDTDTLITAYSHPDDTKPNNYSGPFFRNEHLGIDSDDTIWIVGIGSADEEEIRLWERPTDGTWDLHTFTSHSFPGDGEGLHSIALAIVNDIVHMVYTRANTTNGNETHHVEYDKSLDQWTNNGTFGIASFQAGSLFTGKDTLKVALAATSDNELLCLTGIALYGNYIIPSPGTENVRSRRYAYRSVNLDLDQTGVLRYDIHGPPGTSEHSAITVPIALPLTGGDVLTYDERGYSIYDSTPAETFPREHDHALDLRYADTDADDDISDALLVNSSELWSGPDFNSRFGLRVGKLESNEINRHHSVVFTGLEGYDDPQNSTDPLDHPYPAEAYAFVDPKGRVGLLLTMTYSQDGDPLRNTSTHALHRIYLNDGIDPYDWGHYHLSQEDDTGTNWGVTTFLVSHQTIGYYLGVWYYGDGVVPSGNNWADLSKILGTFFEAHTTDAVISDNTVVNHTTDTVIVSGIDGERFYTFYYSNSVWTVAPGDEWIVIHQESLEISRLSPGDLSGTANLDIFEQYDVIQDNNTLHFILVVYDNTNPQDQEMHHSEFNMDTNTWTHNGSFHSSTDTPVELGSLSHSSGPQPTIAQRSNGDLVVFFASYEAEVLNYYYAVDTGTGFGTPTSFTAPGSEGEHYLTADGNDIHWLILSNGERKAFRRLDSANTLGADQGAGVGDFFTGYATNGGFHKGLIYNNTQFYAGFSTDNNENRPYVTHAPTGQDAPTWTKVQVTTRDSLNAPPGESPSGPGTPLWFVLGPSGLPTLVMVDHSTDHEVPPRFWFYVWNGTDFDEWEAGIDWPFTAPGDTNILSGTVNFWRYLNAGSQDPPHSPLDVDVDGFLTVWIRRSRQLVGQNDVDSSFRQYPEVNHDNADTRWYPVRLNLNTIKVHTTDAIIKLVSDISHTTDVVLLKDAVQIGITPAVETETAEAISIFTVNSLTHNTDAVLVHTVSHTTDVVLAYELSTTITMNMNVTGLSVRDIPFQDKGKVRSGEHAPHIFRPTRRIITK